MVRCVMFRLLVRTFLHLSNNKICSFYGSVGVMVFSWSRIVFVRLVSCVTGVQDHAIALLNPVSSQLLDFRLNLTGKQ